MSTESNPVALARIEAGYSQHTFAHAVGVSRVTVSRWECGMNIPQAGIRAKVAAALGITATDLDGLLDHARQWSIAKPRADLPPDDEGPQPLHVDSSGQAMEQDADDTVQSAIPRLRRVLASIDLPDDGPTRTLPQLRTDVAAMIQWRLEANYSQLAQRLPDLISELARAVDSTDRRSAAGLMTLALRAADGMVYKHGYHDLSAHIIGLMRSAARTAEDPVLHAAAAYVRTETFFATGDLDKASRLLIHAADELASDGLVSASAIASYGALHMRAAVVAGRAGRSESAWDHLAEAYNTALQVPDGVYAGTSFGPSSVRIHQLAVAVELGNRPSVIQRAAAWTPPTDLPAERQSHYYIDLARAQHDLGHHNDSYRCLETARRVAPQHTRGHPQVRAVLSSLLRTRAARHDGLLDLATWASVRDTQ